MTGPTRAVEIVDVSARDGLQSEQVVVATHDKVELVRHAVAAGVARLEVCSFVDPVRVPQMADAEALVAVLPDAEAVTYVGLVLNERGFERAAAAGLTEINVVVVCTDTFSTKNQGCTTEEGVARFGRIASRAHDAGVRVSATLATSFGCPYEGEVAASRVVDIARRVAAVGADEIALADTIGVAVPTEVRERVHAVRDAIAHDGRPEMRLRGHFHNTRNTGVANAVAAVDAGIDALDASLGGIGGCPFAPNATGNVPIEDLAYLLQRMGIATGLDLARLISAVPFVEGVVGHPTPGLLSRAGVFPPRRPAPLRARG